PLDGGSERVVYEQRVTRHHALSPVNGLLNCLVLWSRAHPDLDASLAGLEDWRWEDAEQGIRYAGARSTAWDTAFALRALAAAPSASAPAHPGVPRGAAFWPRPQLP